MWFTVFQSRIMHFYIANGSKMKLPLPINAKGKTSSFEEDKGGTKFSYIFETKNTQTVAFNNNTSSR